MPTIEGSSNDDALTGTEESDILRGLGGTTSSLDWEGTTNWSEAPVTTCFPGETGKIS